MENIPAWLQWVIGICISILGLLGVGKLFEMRVARRYQIEDRNADIHQSNQSAKIEFDQYAFNAFAQRLAKVEENLKEVNEKLAEAMANNARLETENRHLKETNERQENELILLREDRRILNQQVGSLTNIVTKLQTQLEALQKAGLN